ncbi:Rotatin [Schistosoma japonicum]|nr:Rotatin [Schistosoma japonicum]
MCNTDQLDILIEKLSNPLEEIRCRTLSNIQSKLKRGLLPLDSKCLLQLVKVLLHSLDQNPSFETNCIFVILKQLLLNPDTKSLLVSAGGLSLLTKIRNSGLNDELKRHIDDIYTLITEDMSVIPTTECSQENFQKKIQAFSYFNSYGQALTSSDSLQTRVNRFSSSCPSNNETIFHIFPQLYFRKLMSIFCTQLSVCSKDPNICISGLHFFRDVMLNDFPPELFLQRTDLIENLFRILNENNLKIIYSTTSCLISLCQALIRRVYYHLDPNNYTFSTRTDDGAKSFGRLELHEIKETGFSSVDVTQHNVCISTTPKTKVVDSYEEIQRQSYSLLEFCFQLFKAIANGLSIVLNHRNLSLKQDSFNMLHNTSSSKNDWEYKLESRLLLLFDVGINLLLVGLSPHHHTTRIGKGCQSHQTDDPMSFINSILLVVPPTVDLIKSSELPPDFYTCVEQLGSTLSLYSTNQVHHKTTIIESHISWNTSEMVNCIHEANLPGECERLTYIGLITKIFRLISSVFTPETALAVLPTDIKNQLSIALLDVSLLINLEPINESQKIGLPAYVALFNFKIYSTWLLFQQLQLSMFSLVDFLDNSEISLLSTTKDQINETNLTLAMDAVNSLDITGSTRFASNFVEFFSQFYVTHHNTSTATVLWHGQLILLRLLSHEIVAIRKTTYSQLLKLLKVSIHPNFAANPSSSLDTVALLACESFALLLNSYEYISDAGWKKLHHLMIEPASPSPSIKVFRPLTISLGPFASKEPQTTNLKINTLGSIALDWCLGRMNPFGKQNIEEQNLDKRSLMNVLTSCCRLLLHPSSEVRSEAAVVVNWCLRFHWRDLFQGLNSITISEKNTSEISSTPSNCPIVTGVNSVQIDDESCQKRYTSFVCFTSCSYTECLQNQLMTEASLKPPSLILNREQITSLDFGNKFLEPIECLVQMMKLLADDQANLTTRKAAIEQVIIFIRLSWFNQVVKELVLLSMKQNASADIISPTTINSTNSPIILLIPLMVQLACLTAIWDTSTRVIFSWEPDFLCSLIYLSNIFPGSRSFCRDLLDLITLIAFTPVIQVSNESPICLPQDVVAGYQLPFTCPTYSFRSQWRDPSGNEIVGRFRPLSEFTNCTDDDQNTKVLCNLVRRNFQIIWAFACHKGMSNFISHTLFMIDSIPDRNSVDPSVVDVCLKRAREYSPILSQFSLSCLDVTLLLISHPISSFILSLTCIRQATSHSRLLESLGLLYRSLSAHTTQYYCQCDNIERHNLLDIVNNAVMESNKSKDCWWTYAKLDRFMSTLPSCSSDYNLLASVLCTIHEEYICDWLMFLIGDEQSPINYCLLKPKAGIGETDSSRLISAKQHLAYYDLPYLLSDLFNTLYSFNDLTDHSDLNDLFAKYSESQFHSICDLKVYEVCFHWACNTLKEFIDAPFSDLVRLNHLANILARLTSLKFAETILIVNDGEVIENVVNPVSKLLSTFHQQYNYQISHSYMGSSNIVLFLTVINNLIHILSMQPSIQQFDLNDIVLHNNNNNNMDNFHKYVSWIDDEWVLQSLSNHQIEVRALALSILSRVCPVPIWLHRLLTRNVSAETRALLSSHSLVWPSPGALWEIAFHFLLDSSESCWVRIMATHLLINLTVLPLNPRDSVVFFPPATNEFTSGSPEQINLRRPFPFSPVSSNLVTSGCRTLSNNNVGCSIPDPNRANFDIHDILNSDQSSQKLKDDVTQLMNILKPWTDELFSQENMSNGIDDQMECIPVRITEPPKNTILPVYSDVNTNLYLIGLPALHQLLVSKEFFNYLHLLINLYLPQKMFTLSQWHQFNFPYQNTSEQTSNNITGLQSSTMMKSSTTHDKAQEMSTLTKTTEPCSSRSANSALKGGNNDVFINSSSISNPSICTPSLLNTVIQLLINLMHHLPKFVLCELKQHRISPLLMNIIDLNLLQAAVSKISISKSNIINTKGLNYDPTGSFAENSCQQLIHCYTSCLHVLRCQAAMNEECRVTLASDALFLTRIIMILTVPIDYVDLMAPLWKEIFSLLTCLLIYSNNEELKGLNLRLILKPLSHVLPNFLNIILTFVDKAELELPIKECKYRHSVKFCVHARVALQLLTVIMSHQRPISLNPVVDRLEKEFKLGTIKSKHPNSDKSLNDIVYLTRRLLQLSNTSRCFALGGITSPRLSNHNSITMIVIDYRKAIDNALRTLIGLCHSIKITALEDGFLEESLAKLHLLRAKMELSRTSAHMTLESERSTSASKQSLSSRRTMEHNSDSRQQTLSTWLKLSDEMITNMEILHNLVYMCPEARMRAIDSGIIQVIMCLWPLALEDLRILHSILGLLTNLTADCPQVSSVLVNPPNTVKISPYIISQSNQTTSCKNKIQGDISKSDASVILFNSSNSSAMNGSFIQSLCNLIPTYNTSILTDSNARHSFIGNKQTGAHQEDTYRLVFQLLANMSKLFNHLSELNPRTLMKSRRGHFILTLWLQLIINMSFTKDGQQILFSQPNLPTLLVSCTQHCKSANRETALVTLRNLCTNMTLKSKLLTRNFDVIHCYRDILLDSHMDVNSLYAITVVISAIEASIYGSKKIRVFMKSNSCLRYLTNFLESYQVRSEFLTVFPRIRSLMIKLQEQ